MSSVLSAVRFGMCTLLVCSVISVVGCGGEMTGTAGDCATTDADALVALDDDDATDLVASAVTGGDCDEIAVYSENGDVSQTAVELSDGTTVTAEYGDDGRVVAIRTSDGEQVTYTYNDTFSLTRGETPTEAVAFSVARETEDSSRGRNVTQNGTELTFCEELDQLAAAILGACDTDPTLSFCGGPIDEAEDAIRKLCEGQVDEFDVLDGTMLGADEQLFDLTCDGFVTVRGAAVGLTFIGSAVSAGSAEPIDISWTVTNAPQGASVQTQILPPATAVIDSDTIGAHRFTVTCTDAAGNMATDTIDFDIDEDQFFGTTIICSNDNPQVGEEVTFTAAVQGMTDESGASPAQSDADSSFFWEFGDGNFATGQTVTHTYAADGTYDVYLSVIAAVECDFSDVKTIVVGEGGEPPPDDGDFEGDIAVEIIADSDGAAPGGSIGLSVESPSAILPAEYYWDILHSETLDGEFDDAVGQIDDPFSATPQLTGLKEGIVVVGVECYDAAGQFGFNFKVLSFCQGACLGAVIKPEIAEAGVPFVPELFVVGNSDTSTLSYSWFVEFADAGNDVSFSDSRVAAPEVTVAQPGFVVLGCEVSDDAGNSAVAYGEVDVFSEGFDDLFAEFLGLFDGPVGEEFPLFSFIEGGIPPYFCAWQIVNDFSDGGPAAAGVSAGGIAEIFDPFACFETSIFFFEPGCVEIELEVEDVAGAIGFAFFEVCAFGDFQFDCPPDGVCDEDCLAQGFFDPDCDDPCPFDGFCDEQCPIGDPDCFEDFFCIPDDFICDDFCVDFGEPDPDCEKCGEDGNCIDFCPDLDPDCFHEECLPDDGICDFFCEPPDPDCEGGFCGDFICDFDHGEDEFNCPIDCGGSNEDICLGNGFCCPDDDYCDIDCPQPDPQCDECGLDDGVCILLCEPPDPDCGDIIEGCFEDADCDDFDECTVDICLFDEFGSFCINEFDFDNPDCAGEPCQSDAECDDGDPCTFDFCATDGAEGICFHDVDPGCGNGGDCPDDGFCDPQCPGFDPDCDNVLDCPDDGFCDPQCPGFDPDCDNTGGFCGNGVVDAGETCEPPGTSTCDPFCQLIADDICAADEFCNFECLVQQGLDADPDCDNQGVCNLLLNCCPDDAFCDSLECPQPDVDCDLCGIDDGVCILGCFDIPDPDCP